MMEGPFTSSSEVATDTPTHALPATARAGSSADRVAESARIGELLVARHLAVRDRPDMDEASVDRTRGTRPAMPTAGEHADLVEPKDLVRAGGEPLDVGQDRPKHARDDRVGSVVDPSVGRDRRSYSAATQPPSSRVKPSAAGTLKEPSARNS